MFKLLVAECSKLDSVKNFASKFLITPKYCTLSSRSFKFIRNIRNVIFLQVPTNGLIVFLNCPEFISILVAKGGLLIRHEAILTFYIIARSAEGFSL